MSTEQLKPEFINAQAPRLAPRRPPNPGLVALGIVVLLLTILGSVASYMLYTIDQSYRGKIYPNVSIHGIDVGELTQQQAEAALRARFGTFLDAPLTLRSGEQVWKPKPSEIGITFDFTTAVDDAYRAGRENSLLENMQQVAAIWQNGLDVPVRASFDERTAQRYIETLAADIDAPARDAALTRQGTVINTAPAQTGRQVLVDATLHEFDAKVARFEPADVQLQQRTIAPRLPDTTVQRAADQLSRMFAAPLKLDANGRQYLLIPSDIAKIVSVSRATGANEDSLAVQIDEATLDSMLAAFVDETATKPMNPRVAWNDGKPKIARAGVPGSRIDISTARTAVVAALQNGTTQVDLPVTTIDPPVTAANIGQVGLDELISIGKSDFTGSAEYRIHNIGAGMKLLDGLLIAPNEEFSFNNNIGDIDEANGFVKGYAIIENRTQLEFGGGICQDSTTMFRAAFWGGFPITERWGHSFYISWYNKYALGPLGNGPGLDATIFTGGPDFKFLNDTGKWLLLQAWSNPDTGVAQIEIYGTKLNRTVDIKQRMYDLIQPPSAPVFAADRDQPIGTIKQSDRARPGITIDVQRIITINGVQQKPELFRTRFRPWPNIFTVNPTNMHNGRPTIAVPHAQGYGSIPGAPRPPAPPRPTAAPVDPNAPPPVDPNTPPPVDPNAEQPLPAPAVDAAQPPPVDPNTPPADPNAPLPPTG